MLDQRPQYLRILAHLDQMEAEAAEILSEVPDTELIAYVEELRELWADMRAKVEERLEQ